MWVLLPPASRPVVAGAISDPPCSTTLPPLEGYGNPYFWRVFEGSRGSLGETNGGSILLHCSGTVLRLEQILSVLRDVVFPICDRWKHIFGLADFNQVKSPACLHRSKAHTNVHKGRIELAYSKFSVWWQCWSAVPRFCFSWYLCHCNDVESLNTLERFLQFDK